MASRPGSRDVQDDLHLQATRQLLALAVERLDRHIAHMNRSIETAHLQSQVDGGVGDQQQRRVQGIIRQRTFGARSRDRMAKQCRLDDLLSSVPPSPCSDDHLNKLGLELSDWKVVAMFLGLKDGEIKDIQQRGESTAERSIMMLRKWTQSCGEQATYRYLASVFCNINRRDLAEKICELVEPPTSPASELSRTCCSLTEMPEGQEGTVPPEVAPTLERPGDLGWLTPESLQQMIDKSVAGAMRCQEGVPPAAPSDTMTDPADIDLQKVDGDTILELDDLLDVKKKIRDVRHRWYELGLCLRIKLGDLDALKTDKPMPEEGLTAVLKLFLKKDYNVKRFGEPTWRRLVEVVQDTNGGGDPALAEAIAKEHPVGSFEPATQEMHSLMSLAHVSLPQPPNDGGATGNHISFTFHDAKVLIDGSGLKFECFEPHSHDTTTKLDLSFGSLHPRAGKKQTGFEVYEMKQFPHGLCLIINNEEFARQTDREGTALDERNLVQTFRFLGYKVEVHRDRTASSMVAIFEKMRVQDHSKYDSFVCCILTHGKEGKVYGSDSKAIEISTIVSKLNGYYCKTLAGKPKLFFIQACRGSGKDSGTRVDSDSAEVLPRRVEADFDPIAIPDEADFFFGYATPPGKVAWRDLDHGSWYVSELCRSLCTHAAYADLNHMIQEAQKHIGGRYDNVGYKQAPEFTTRLRKDVYFW